MHIVVVLRYHMFPERRGCRLDPGQVSGTFGGCPGPLDPRRRADFRQPIDAAPV